MWSVWTRQNRHMMILKSFKHFSRCSETLIWVSPPPSAASCSLTDLNSPPRANRGRETWEFSKGHLNRVQMISRKQSEAASKHLQGQVWATKKFHSACVTNKRSPNRVALGKIPVSDAANEYKPRAVRSVQNTLCFVVTLHKGVPNKMFPQQLPLMWVQALRAIKAVFVCSGRRIRQISFSP